MRKIWFLLLTYKKMKVFVLSVLFLVLGTSFMLLATTASSVTISHGMIFSKGGKIDIVFPHNRKLKQEKVYNSNNASKEKDDENVSLEDYHPIDPSPSSKAAITAGPIEHGTPLMPYIPKPATPPRQGGPFP